VNRNYAQNIREVENAVKQFDLQVRDTVVANEKELGVKAKYEVIGIYENVFSCKKISGQGKWLTSFCNSDYTTGAVKKIDK